MARLPVLTISEATPPFAAHQRAVWLQHMPHHAWTMVEDTNAAMQQCGHSVVPSCGSEVLLLATLIVTLMQAHRAAAAWLYGYVCECARRVCVGPPHPRLQVYASDLLHHLDFSFSRTGGPCPACALHYQRCFHHNCHCQMCIDTLMCLQFLMYANAIVGCHNSLRGMLIVQPAGNHEHMPVHRQQHAICGHWGHKWSLEAPSGAVAAELIR